MNIMKKLLICTTFLALTKAQEMLKTCTREDILNCPQYSLCSRVNSTDDETLKCICLQNFEFNTKWRDLDNFTEPSKIKENYCLPLNNTLQAKENKLLVFIRSPVRKDHLVFSILMVLLAATIAVAVLYGLTVLRPIKRTKAVYKKLRYKRQNITPLQEMDELEMNRRYEMQIL